MCAVCFLFILLILGAVKGDECTGPEGAECDRHIEETVCNNDELCHWVIGEVSPFEEGFCGNEQEYPKMAGDCADLTNLVDCNTKFECRWYSEWTKPCPNPSKEICETLMSCPTKTGSCGGTSGGQPIPGCDQYISEWDCHYIGECEWFWSKEGFCDAVEGRPELKATCGNIELEDACAIQSECEWRNREEPCSVCPEVVTESQSAPMKGGIPFGAGVLVGGAIGVTVGVGVRNKKEQENGSNGPGEKDNR